LTRLGPFIVAVLCVVAIALVSGTSGAQPRVLIVIDESSGAAGLPDRQGAVVQLRAELETAGFEVVVQRSGAADSARALDQAAHDADAFAAITVFDIAGGISGDVWVTDRVTGKTLLRRVEATDDEASRIVALRAVELLDASLVELDLPRPRAATTTETTAGSSDSSSEPVANEQSRASPDESAAAPVEGHVESLPDEPAEELSPWALAVGMAALGGPGGLRPSVAPAVIFGARFGKVLGGEVAFVGPVRGRLRADVGSATVDQELGMIRLRAEPWSSERRFSGFALAGIGVYRLGGVGWSSSPYAGATDRAWASGAAAGLGGRARLTRALALVVRADGFFVVPRPAVRFSEAPVARAPAPGLLGTFAGEVSF
jgi:hypothetical protein